MRSYSVAEIDELLRLNRVGCARLYAIANGIKVAKTSSWHRQKKPKIKAATA